ncbi:MAG: DUF6268 family outer membrane beta-barrel protein [Bacteroidetes bacterium]|nr:DUF6268 family outer membrane beta-barrel protein [Bacteroidota bacterium]
MKTLTRSKILIILLTTFVAPMISSSQPFIDPLNVKYQYFPQQSFNNDAKNTMNSGLSEATILLPLELKNKDLVLVNGDVTKMNFTISGDQQIHTSLYSTSLAIGYDHGWKNDKWRTMVMLIPKINSDFKDISSEDFQVGGVVLANYKKNDHLKYHFGLYYNREFFGDYFIPLLGIEWKINDHMNLFGDLPSNMNFEYKIDKKIYAGAAFQSVISSYRLSKASGSSYVREGDNALGHDQLKLYLNYYIADHLVIFAEAGQTFYRMYKLYDNQNNAIENSAALHTNDGMFYTTGIAYRIRLD